MPTCEDETSPKTNLSQVLYVLTSVWLLPTPNPGPNMLFHIFCVKNIKKEEKIKNDAKIKFFRLAPKHCSCLFVSENIFYQWKCVFSGNKSLIQSFAACPKNTYLPHFPFLLLFHVFHAKNMKKYGQYLECTAPKRCSKYTTAKPELKWALNLISSSVDLWILFSRLAKLFI